jgi:phospholipid/cholesterol/gamma-HCH transport system ATP-binding protein
MPLNSSGVGERRSLLSEREPTGALPHNCLADALMRGLVGDSPECKRLSYARSVVAFGIHGERNGATMLLDRTPPQVVETWASPEITIELSPAQAGAFARGQLNMSAAVISGEVTANGPVRRYLEVDPIVRALLARQDGTGRTPAATRAAASGHRAAAVEPDLLAIQTCALHKSFNGQPVLAGAELAVPEGVIAAVLGPSGTGKSVLLKHLIGLLRPDSGDVLIRGRSLRQMDRGEILRLRREIGVMFQDGALFSRMNVFDNVAFPLRQHTNLPEEIVHEIVTDHLRAVGLAEAADRLPSELSGGMRKRAGLARALALDPGIVLCDEPDSGLDPVRTALLGNLLVDQHARYGGTMLIITHNVALARQISDHISILWKGRVLQSGLTEHLLTSSDAFVQQFLGGEADGPLGMDA